MITQMNWERIRVIQDKIFELNEILCIGKEQLENANNTLNKEKMMQLNAICIQLHGKFNMVNAKSNNIKKECDALKLQVGYESSDTEITNHDH